MAYPFSYMNPKQYPHIIARFNSKNVSLDMIGPIGGWSVKLHPLLSQCSGGLSLPSTCLALFPTARSHNLLVCRQLAGDDPQRAAGSNCGALAEHFFPNQAGPGTGAECCGRADTGGAWGLATWQHEHGCAWLSPVLNYSLLLQEADKQWGWIEVRRAVLEGCPLCWAAFEAC